MAEQEAEAHIIPPEFRDWEYRKRRAQNWMLVGLLYSFFYMTRYNFSAMAPALQDVFGWTKSDLGLFEMLLPLVYGLSVVINAPLADRFGGRKAFLFGAAGVVVMNSLFGACAALVHQPATWAGAGDARHLVKPAALAWGLSPRGAAWLMSSLWAINGYFQSFGALSIVKINAQWFHLRERGTFGAIFGVLIRFGLILAFSGVPLIASVLPWQWAFWIPAMFVFLLFLGTLFFVTDTPEEAGFEPRDTGDASSGDDDERVSVIWVLKKVFASPTMWLIAAASMMIGFVRRSVVDAWFPVYFKDVHHVGRSDVAYQATAWGIALLGIAGGFAFGILSDRVYRGRRAPVVVYGFVGMALSLLLFYAVDRIGMGPYGAVGSLVLLSFFVNGAHGMIGGAASMDFGGRKAAATAAGLFDGMQYLAGAIAGWAVGRITTDLGWQAWKLWPVPFALAGALMMAKLWNVTPRKSGSH